MTKLYLDINQFGEPHWLGPLAKFDPTTIREYHRQRWLDAQKAKLAASQAKYRTRLLGDAGFDPSQDRDKNGRWTRTGQINLGNKADWIREKIDKTADDLNFPRDKIFMSDNVRKFTLNGQEYTSGGCAVGSEDGFTDTDGIHYEKGDIVIYGLENTGFDFDMPVTGIVAHEIQHQRYREVMEQAKKQLNAATLKYNSSFPFEDAAVKNSARNLYPIAAAINDAGLYDFEGLAKLAKTDGVTGYSKAYWEAQAKGESSQDLAINETLAEIANLDIVGDLRNPPEKIEFSEFKSFIVKELEQRYKERGSRMATPEEYQAIMEDPLAWADMVDRERFRQRFGLPFDELNWNARTQTVEFPDYNAVSSKRVLSPEWRKLYDTINEQYAKIKAAGMAPAPSTQTDNPSAPLKIKLGKPKTSAAMEATEELYKTGYQNPLNPNEIVWSWGEKGDKMAMLEFGRPDEGMLYLKHIRTFPQRQGIGRKAMEELKTFAASKGLGIWLQADEFSDTPHKVLVKFYKSLGFKDAKDEDALVWHPKN